MSRKIEILRKGLKKIVEKIGVTEMMNTFSRLNWLRLTMTEKEPVTLEIISKTFLN
jgi:hypothetical protein